MIGLIKGTARQVKSVSGLPLPIASYKSNSKAPIQELSLSINPTQSGSGDPYPAGGGKNKFDKSTATENSYINSSGNTSGSNGWAVSDYVKAEENTTYTLSGSGATGSAAYTGFYNESKGVISTVVNTQTTFTTPVGTAYIRISMLSANIDTTQLELGSTATAYAPYSNIRPITGVSSVNVENWGKYIRALPATAQSVTNNGITFTIKSNGQVDINGTATALASATIPVTPFTVFSDDGRTIRFHNTFASSTSNVVFKNGGTTVDSWNLGVLNRTYSNFGVLAGKYVDTIQIAIPSGATINGSLMVDFNVSGTGNTYTIDLDGTRYGATLDVVRGKLKINKAIVDLGNLNWNYFARNTRFVVTLNNGKFTNSGSGLNTALCEIYPVVTVVYGVMPDKSISVGSNFISGSTCALVVHDEAYTNANELKTALRGRHIVYELATPIEIDLTPTQINSLLGQNNIWHDGNGDVDELVYQNRQLYYGR